MEQLPTAPHDPEVGMTDLELSETRMVQEARVLAITMAVVQELDSFSPGILRILDEFLKQRQVTVSNTSP